MNSFPPTLVHVVDDDDAVLRGLLRLLSAEGLPACGHPSAEAFLAALVPEEAGCALIDLDLPELGGLELQERLRSLDPGLPVVFLTGRGDIPASVRAMKAGAVDFLTKPVVSSDLLATLHEALARRAHSQRARQLADEARRRLARLTPREAEVLGGVSRGLLNKQIAAELGMAEKTVKVHRAHGLEKLGVVSVAGLMPFASRLPSSPHAPGPLALV